VSPVVAVVAIMASSALGITSQVPVIIKGLSHGKNNFVKVTNKSDVFAVAEFTVPCR
jgi:hypothetical protein